MWITYISKDSTIDNTAIQKLNLQEKPYLEVLRNISCTVIWFKYSDLQVKG